MAIFDSYVSLPEGNPGDWSNNGESHETLVLNHQKQQEKNIFAW